MKKFIIFLKGILIGFTSIAIPGVSASTIAIILGLYYQMIDAISSILKDFKKSILFLGFLMLGFSLGSLVGANVISLIYDKYPFVLVLIILGFIIGSVPSMLKTLKKDAKKISNYVVMFLVIAFVIGFSFLPVSNRQVVLKIDMPWIEYLLLAFVGLISATTLVIPGMDFAVVLLALGYYEAFVSLLDITNMSIFLHNLVVLVVFLGSYGIGTFFLSKFIKKLTVKFQSQMNFAIFSFVIASPYVIIKQCLINNPAFVSRELTILQIVLAIVFFIIALIIAVIMHQINNPDDDRIEARKKRNMFRFFFTIGIQAPLAIYYLWKLRHILRKNLYTFEERYAICQKIVKRINAGGNIHVKIYGQEHLTKEATLYIVNHQGRYDGICVLTALKDYPCTIIAEKVRITTPIYTEVFKMLNGEYVDKTDMRKQVEIIKNVGKRLEEGTSFIAFIEGKYENNGNNLQEFQTGVLHPAYQSHCIVTPVVIYDSYKVFSVSSIRRIEPEVHILEPLKYEDYQDLDKKAFASLLKQKMQAKLDEINIRKQAENKKNKKKKIQ